MQIERKDKINIFPNCFLQGNFVTNIIIPLCLFLPLSLSLSLYICKYIGRQFYISVEIENMYNFQLNRPLIINYLIIIIIPTVRASLVNSLHNELP